jgi:hypothetical protein
MLCISNFNEKLILICNVDIKTRSREIKKELKTKDRPTFMYQINEDYLLIGTDTGKLELWSIENINKNIYDAHQGSEYGITAIIPLFKPSELITNERPNAMGGESSESTFIATAAGDKVTFKIWKIVKNGNEIDLQMHIKVDTRIPTGIHYVLQTSPTQIVCCNDNNVLKFYDFVDKVALREKEENEK